MSIINIASLVILSIYAIYSHVESRKFVKRTNQYIELDRLHAKHLNAISDYQLVMFDCIAKTDYYGAGIAHQSINEELESIRSILSKKAELIK